MPQMGYDMQQGTVVRWLKSEGSQVKTGEVIAEIETDKAVVEFESYASGVLTRILVPEGTTVPVGQPIAILGAEGEEVPEGIAAAARGVTQQEAPPAAEPAEAVAPPTPQRDGGVPAPAAEIKASPVARRLADEQGIDLRQVKGTGPGGRITKDDVLAFAQRAAAAPPAAARPTAPPREAPPPAPEVVKPGARVPLSKMRQQIARVTVKSKREIPHYYVTAEVDMTRAMELRQQINQALEQEGVRVTVNDLVVKACVGALKKYPKFNAYLAEDSIQLNEQINIGIAIAEEEGLIVPAIIDCGSKSLSELARASKDLIERAKNGSLRPQEYTGGTFSVSNMGMFDVSSFVAIILPPQTAMLAVGTVTRKPVVKDDQVAIAQVMNITLSADHRVSDGAEGARFVGEVKRLLEDPLALLL